MIALSLCILVVCFAGAFFFAGTETGFISWNPLKVTVRARQGNISARLALHLMRNRGRVISALLIGNNICIVGASLAFLYLYERLDAVTALNLSWVKSPESWFLAPVLVVLGEMLPKSLYRIYSFRLTIRSIPLFMFAYWVTFPASWILGSLGSKGRRRESEGEAYRTRVREDMLLVAGEGARQGLIFDNVKEVLDGILGLRDRVAADVAEPLDSVRAGLVRPDSSAAEARASLGGGKDALLVAGAGGTAVGWVPLLDLAGAADTTPVAELMKPLDVLGGDTPLLSVLSARHVHPRFRTVKASDGHEIGIFDRNRFYCTVFEGLVSQPGVVQTGTGISGKHCQH